MLCVLIDTDNRAMLYRPGVGDRQGDGPAAQRYVLAQEATIRGWQRRTMGMFERTCVELFDPWSETWIAPAHVLFADDLARFGVARSVREIVRKIVGWRDTLRTATLPLSIQQSDKKLQILVDLCPASERAETELKNDLRAHGLQDNLTRKALHLGAHHCLIAKG